MSYSRNQVKINMNFCVKHKYSNGTLNRSPNRNSSGGWLRGQWLRRLSRSGGRPRRRRGPVSGLNGVRRRQIRRGRGEGDEAAAAGDSVEAGVTEQQLQATVWKPAVTEDPLTALQETG